MSFLFDFLSSTFGYILWFFFDAVSNYALAITLFAFVINVLMFPIAIKRQKTTARNARLAVKQQELKNRYEKNPKKYNEEIARLYEKEGINPMSGCFTTLVLPLILWSGIYGAVTKPLQNTLHISPDKVASAVAVLPQVEELSGKITKGYEQLQLVRHFSAVKDKLSMLNSEELADIEEYSSGFNFMGLNLLGTPKGTDFSQMLWVIPILCFASSAFTMYIGQRMMRTQNQMQGCAKFTPYFMLLFTAYIAYTIPAAVGLYWIINSLFGAIQSIILNKFYNIYTMNAHDEAARFALLKVQESSVKNLKDE